MTNLEKTLLRISKLLSDNNVPYMLIGGYSMTLHGCPRMTEDLDITLGVDVDHVDTIIEILKNDFSAIVESPKEFAAKTNVLLLVDNKTGVRVDLIFSFIDFELQAVASADIVKINGAQIRNISLDNLIIYKMMAGRERDKEDVRLLLTARRSDVDIDAVSSKLQEFADFTQTEVFLSWKKLLADMSNAKD